MADAAFEVEYNSVSIDLDHLGRVLHTKQHPFLDINDLYLCRNSLKKYINLVCNKIRLFRDRRTLRESAYFVGHFVHIEECLNETNGQAISTLTQIFREFDNAFGVVFETNHGILTAFQCFQYLTYAMQKILHILIIINTGYGDLSTHDAIQVYNQINALMPSLAPPVHAHDNDGMQLDYSPSPREHSPRPPSSRGRERSPSPGLDSRSVRQRTDNSGWGAFGSAGMGCRFCASCVARARAAAGRACVVGATAADTGDELMDISRRLREANMRSLEIRNRLDTAEEILFERKRECERTHKEPTEAHANVCKLQRDLKEVEKEVSKINQELTSFKERMGHSGS